jgi:hypothetical protein
VDFVALRAPAPGSRLSNWPGRPRFESTVDILLLFTPLPNRMMGPKTWTLVYFFGLGRRRY